MWHEFGDVFRPRDCLVAPPLEMTPGPVIASNARQSQRTRIRNNSYPTEYFGPGRTVTITPSRQAVAVSSEPPVGTQSMTGSTETGKRRRSIWGVLLPLILTAVVASCGYRFSGGPGSDPYPESLKTVQVDSAINNTTVTGIERELTNDLRREYALGTRLEQVNSGGDLILKTSIVAYDETTPVLKADGMELIRHGTLKVACNLAQTGTNKVLWHKAFAASQSYNVTDSIGGTLTNRRRAISRMIKDLVPRIHRSMFDNF